LHYLFLSHTAKFKAKTVGQPDASCYRIVSFTRLWQGYVLANSRLSWSSLKVYISILCRQSFVHWGGGSAKTPLPESCKWDNTVSGLFDNIRAETYSTRGRSVCKNNEKYLAHKRRNQSITFWSRPEIRQRHTEVCLIPMSMKIYSLPHSQHPSKASTQGNIQISSFRSPMRDISLCRESCSDIVHASVIPGSHYSRRDART
jgi:ribosomal protein S14